MIDLLPESTILAMEIRDLAERWPEIRAVPVITRFLHRLLTGSDLEPDVLPRLAGNEAIVALIPSTEGRWVMPVALLRPLDIAEAEGILGGIALLVGDGAPLAVQRGRGALWVGLPGASDRLKQIATGDGTPLRSSLAMDEVSRRLPAGGMARGWINPGALRTLLLRQVEGVHPAPLEILRSFATAKLEAIRFIGFRRELTTDGVVTDVVMGLDASALPHEMAHVLNPFPEDSRLLPSPLPAGTMVASSFTTEAEACLAWLRHVAASDPRGPLRNLEFWMEEFSSRTGLDLGRDLFGALGEHGWLFLLQGATSETVRAAAILETHDPERIEKTLLELRAWLAGHLQGRTLGTLRLRLRDNSLNGRTVHSSALWTPFAELPGPAFLITDEHLLAGIGEPALRAGLRLLATKDTWTRAPAEANSAADPLPESMEETAKTVPTYPQKHIRVVGPAIARWLAALADSHGSGREQPLVSALTHLLNEMNSIEVDIWYEEEIARIRSHVRFDGD
jgi:hypothetical protein